MKLEEIKKRESEDYLNQGVLFIPRFMCDHGNLGSDDRCYSCGASRWECKEDIRDKQHFNELTRIKELKEAKKD